MERVVERSNMQRALRRVVQNRGSAGVDGLTVAELNGWLKAHWLRVKDAFPAGEYMPQPVRRVDIPKPQGGVRTLGVAIEDLNPLLRGWIGYFRHAPGVRILEDLDQWVRRRLRCVLWRQWKRSDTRRRRLIALGLDAERAGKSSANGRGPWWNAGAPHMTQTASPSFFAHLGLVSLLATRRRLPGVP